jgi:hypothetical protein
MTINAQNTIHVQCSQKSKVNNDICTKNNQSIQQHVTFSAQINFILLQS